MPTPRASAVPCPGMTSITVLKVLKNGAAAVLWIVVWQAAAMAVNRTLLLPVPTPAETLAALWRMAGEGSFWLSVGMSLVRICAGFLLAFLVGSACAAASVRWRVFKWLTAPVAALIRAIPVAVFTILVFLWVKRAYIPSTIVFLTVLPVVWSNVETGLRSVDRGLTEMAAVFGMRHREVFWHVTLPQIRPYASAAIATGLGFAWKSGIAAEVICRTQGSLGDMLWSGKASVSYDEVFALTVVIVACSSALQGAAARLTRKEGGHAGA